MCNATGGMMGSSAATAKQNKNQELYKDIKLKYLGYVYAIGYIQLLIYAVCSLVSYAMFIAWNGDIGCTTPVYSAQSLCWVCLLGWSIYCIWMIGHEAYHCTMNGDIGCTTPVYSAQSLCWVCLLGWSIYCIWMIGHEAYHYTMTSSKNLNEIIGFMTMDCIVCSKETWRYAHHTVHHRTPLSENPHDGQRLIGTCILDEMANIILVAMKYQILDFKFLFSKPSPKLMAGIIVRYYLHFRLPLNLLVYFIFVLGFCVNYLALLSHAIPDETQDHKDCVTHQLRTSIDIYPFSHFACFISGALNAHSVHHVYPSLPRALHPSAAQKLARIYPDEYRCIDDLKTLCSLWILCHQKFEFGDVKMRNKLTNELRAHHVARQIALDCASIFALIWIVRAIPPVRIF